MVKILKWIILHALMMACLCWGMFRDVEWAQNIVVFMVWLNLFVVLLVLSIKDCRAKVRKERGNIPKWAHIAYDVVFIVILAAFGWFVAAAAYTVSSFLCLGILFGDLETDTTDQATEQSGD